MNNTARCQSPFWIEYRKDDHVQEHAMSLYVKALLVIAAVSLGALASGVFPPETKVASHQAVKSETPKDDTDAAPKPPTRSGRGEDLPLRHAILRDEKDTDSPEAVIIRTLGKPTTVEFVDLPLEDCITFLKEYHNINIWLDKATLTDEGVALDQPVTLKLAGVTLRSVLKLLLEPVQLTYVIEDEVMKITTSARAGEKLTTRVYPVGDLVIPIITPRGGRGGMGMMGGMGNGMMGGGMGMGMGGGMMGGMGMGGMGMGMMNVP